MLTTRARFFVFYFGCFLVSTTYGMTFLIQSLVAMRGGNEAEAGIIIAAATISTVLFALYSGHLSDRFGITRIVMVSAALLASVCFGFASFRGFLLIICGLCFGCGWGLFFTLVPVILGMNVRKEQRTYAFAIHSGCMLAGMAAGPVIARLCQAVGISLSWAFVIAGSLSLLGMLFFFLIQHFGQASATIRYRLSLQSLRYIFSSHALIPLLMVGLGGANFGAFMSFQTSYAAYHQLDYIIFFTGFMLSAIGARLFLSSFLTSIKPWNAARLFSGLVFISFLLFFLLSPNLYVYFLNAALFGVSYGLLYPVTYGLCANLAPQENTSQALVLFGVSYFIGLFGFPLVIGSLIHLYDVPTMGLALCIVALLNFSLSWKDPGGLPF